MSHRAISFCTTSPHWFSALPLFDLRSAVSCRIIPAIITMSASSGLSGDKPVTIFPRSHCETLHRRRDSSVDDTMTTGSRRDSGDPVRIFPAQPPARGPCAARQALPGADNSPRLGPYHIYASGPRAPHAQREDEPKLEHARAESEQGQALPLQPTRRTPPESSYPHISLNGANLTRRAQTQDISRSATFF